MCILGSRCELDIDQCRTGEVSCDLESEVCVNRPGNDTCECRSGFELKASGKCEGNYFAGFLFHKMIIVVISIHFSYAVKHKHSTSFVTGN